MSDAGLSPTRYCYEISTVLFVRLWANGKHWEQFRSIREAEGAKSDDVLNHFTRVTLKDLNRKYPESAEELFKLADLTDPDKFIQLCEVIDGVGKFEDLDFDIKGEAFEYFIDKEDYNRGSLGQFFTPRPVVRSIIDYLTRSCKKRHSIHFVGPVDS